MTTRTAPYRHADGSNCWTKNCRYRLNASMVVDQALKPKTVTPQKPASLPEKLVWSGAKLNQQVNFVTELPDGYDAAKHHPIRNAPAELTWAKPHGGLWVSPINAEGESEWRNLIGFSPATHKAQKIVFNDDAKVVVIDSLEDYRTILDKYPYYPKFDDLSESEKMLLNLGHTSGLSSVNPDGTAKRNIDFEKLSKEYDGIYLTMRGLYACGKADYRGETTGTDISLYLWDIESAVIFNKKSITVA